MKEFIAKNEIAGAVTLVVTGDRILHFDVAGKADMVGDLPMRLDTIFWIASMTKPITGAAIVMLHEEGKLSIHDPVGKYIPELAGLKTADGKPATVTLKHLLTHTSGLAEAPAGTEKTAKTLAELMPLYAARPLGFEPGSQWRYCQSGINTLARIVEVVSKQSFTEFLDTRLFGPLGMKDTTFYLSAEQLPRLTKAYRHENGKATESPISILGGHSPTYRDRYPAANGGLFSTAMDYARFCQMLINEGELDGRRYMKPESVRLMRDIHSGDVKTGFTEGNGWGLGCCVIRQPQGVTEALSPGSFGHGGAYGTQAWIDPVKKRAYILMVQRSNFPNADGSDVRRAFQAAAAGGIRQ